MADDLYYFTILDLEEVKTAIGRDTLEITKAPGRLLQEDRVGQLVEGQPVERIRKTSRWRS
jgi:hypothetical protein